MRADHIIATQLLIAQSINGLAKSIEGSTGIGLTPVPFALLPVPPARGMIACITDSTMAAWGDVIAGGGTNAVLAWYNGTNWTVIAA